MKKIKIKIKKIISSVKKQFGKIKKRLFGKLCQCGEK
tara:strand:+ start:456 stop:566 length:111 start_codon:yes stop_codon:yes gene_type:complete